MPVSPVELGRRLRSAREAAGLTQDDAATHLGIARPAMVLVEAGDRGVSSFELDRLAALYGRDIRDFLVTEYAEDDTLRAVFRAQPDLVVDAALRRTLLDWRNRARALTDLESLLELPRRLCTAGPYPGAALTGRWNAIQQGEQLADEERARLGLGRAPVPELPALLESQGIRTALVPLDDDASGLTLQERGQDLVILINAKHAVSRHRFSFAHEYAHVLIDRARGSVVSRAGDRDELIEMRANSFAAGFLMPAEGVLEFVRELGKGYASRESVSVHDGSKDQPLRVEGRTAPGSQALQMYDVIQAADYFGVSRIAMIYRFKTLRLLKQPEVDALRAVEEKRWADDLAKLVGDGDQGARAGAPSAFQRRFVSTALEAYRRELISRGRLLDLARLIELDEAQFDWLLDAVAGIEEADDGGPAE